MSENKRPRRSDSRNRDDNPKLFLESELETPHDETHEAIETTEQPSWLLRDEPIPAGTRHEIFGNDFFEIRECFFRIVDSRPDMKPHALKCILWDMLPPYEDEYPSEYCARLIQQMDGIKKRLEDIGTCMSPDGSLGYDVRSIRRKTDKIQSISEDIQKHSTGEDEATEMTAIINPVIELLDTTTNNSSAMLTAAAESIDAAVDNAKKLNNRVSIPTYAFVIMVILLTFSFLFTGFIIGKNEVYYHIADITKTFWSCFGIASCVTAGTIGYHQLSIWLRRKDRDNRRGYY